MIDKWLLRNTIVAIRNPLKHHSSGVYASSSYTNYAWLYWKNLFLNGRIA